VSSVRSIASREDYLWVGTTNELKLYQYQNNDYRLIRDMERIAYTYRGMIKFNEITETIEQEYFIKEYQRVQVDRNSAIQTSAGKFVFGGINGFILFHPDSIQKRSIPPQACITDLQIFNESLDDSHIRKNKFNTGYAIPYAEAIDLTYKEKVLTFVYSAMDYNDPQKNLYAYFLEGFDENWNEVGDRNSATYTNIPPGKYEFKVKAANSDGIWSTEPSAIKVSIAPPWWKTKLAYILYGIIFIGILYFFNRYSIIEAREKGRIMLEHVQYEKEHDLNELKSHFFTNITHEFRTPLTLIQGPVEEILKSTELPAPVRKHVELIQRNAQRLLRLVNQLMEFRKAEKQNLEVYLQKSDVVFILNDIYESFQSMADSKDIEFTLKLQSPGIIAIIDYEKFEKAIFNIVSNAFKYTEDGGSISISAGIEDKEGLGNTLVVEVEDTGIGIDEKYHEKVFERFFQVNQKQTQSTGGIGLYLSRAFVELHRGNIELESEPGKGSCFRVLIPVDGEAHKSGYMQGAKAEEKSITTSGVTAMSGESTWDQALILSNRDRDRKLPMILIVEDDSELIDFIISGLSSEFNLTGTFNGQEGLEFARKLNPDIIISDIMMPEMDGIEMITLLRKDLVTSHIPVIFLTAKTMREDEITGLKVGAVDYIYKPFNLEALKLKILNILENRRTIHEKFRTSQLLEPEHIELSSLDEKFLKDAVDTVNRFLDDHSLDVDKFSYEMGISANQAYRKLKALTGQTAKEFIRNQRLKTSASLLLQKKRSISEIIYMVGFSSPSYFTKCFKEYYGCTPKEYIEWEGKTEWIR